MQSDVWGSISNQGVVTHITGGNFAHSSITINRWLRDFLWAQASQFGIATARDFESHDDITEECLYQNILAFHFGQLPIIFLWSFGNPFHVAWGALGQVNIAYSGLYQWWYTIDLGTNEDLYTGALFLLFLSAISLIAGWLHLQPKWQPSVSWCENVDSRLNRHLSGLFGVMEYVKWNNFLDVLPSPQGLGSLFTGQWNLYSQNPDSSGHLFGTSQGAGTAILTILRGFHPQTRSLWLTNISHHHLAIGFVFLITDHMYRTNFEIGLYDAINNSIHFQLGLALASLGVITSLVAQHMYTLPPYAFIAQDFTTQAADYNPEHNEDNVLARMLDHKEAIKSHLSWASLFLGFHTLGLYDHNDVMLAFGTPEKQILIEPIFAQWIQSTQGKTSYGFDVLLSSMNGPAFNAGRRVWLPGWLNAINENDFLVHHAIALGLHTTTLILVKGALDARGSKFMPDKKDLGYSFPCYGLGRGGTCDISAWDVFYLTVFWMLNTIGWARERTPLANLIRLRDKLVALSIVQARLVGLAHFSIGYIFTYAAFLIVSTSGKFG
ncbi:hypothetical protein AMTRI_Chr07g26450 [Amborella trichopoda]